MKFAFVGKSGSLAHRLRDVSGTLQRANASCLIGIRLLEFRVSIEKFWQP